MFEHDVPQFELTVSGLMLSADLRARVVSLTYDNHLDKANMLSVQLADPTLELVDSSLFEVGQTVRVRLGYEGRMNAEMTGAIASVEPSFPSNGGPQLTIRSYDRSFPLRHNSVARSFQNLNDTAIVAQLAVENLLVPVIVPSFMPPKPSWQHEGSDWSLLAKIAERNFYHVYVAGDQLYFHPPRIISDRVVLQWGRLELKAKTGTIELSTNSTKVKVSETVDIE